MPPSPQPTGTKLPGPLDYALLTALGMIWGVSFILIKIGVSSLPAIPFTLTRMALTAALMVALMLWMRQRLPPWGRTWWFVALSAFLGNALPFLLIAWGEERVDGALAAILMSPSPLFAAVLAHLLTREDKLNRYKLAGIGLGVVGIAVLMGLDNVARLGTDLASQLAILAAGCCYGVNVVINRGLTGGPAVANVTAVMVVSTAMLLPLGLLPGMWDATPTRASILAMITLAIFSTAAGTLMMLDLVRRQGAAFTAQVNFLTPVFGIIAGAVLLAERPSARSIAGLALILAGVAIARRGSGLTPPASPTEPGNAKPS